MATPVSAATSPVPGDNASEAAATEPEEAAIGVLDLQCGDTVVITLCWEELQDAGTNLAVENFEQDCPVHEAVAFEVNTLLVDGPRKIFVVRCPAAAMGAQMIMRFDDTGVPAQPPCEPLGEFMADWKDADPPRMRIVGGPKRPQSGCVDDEPPGRVVDEVAPLDGRVRIAFGTGEQDDPIKWWGGTVGHVAEDGSRTIAMDDGTIEAYTPEQFSEARAEGGIEQLDPARGGLTDNKQGTAMAAGLAWAKDGRSAKGKVVGALVGDTGKTLAGDILYEAFHVKADAFAETTQHTTRGAHITQQDRYGFHTFRRGDTVCFKLDPACTAQVSSLTFPKAGQKYLLLRECASGVFFVGKYTEWMRKVKVDGADVDVDDGVVALDDPEEMQALADAQAESEVIQALVTHNQIASAANHTSKAGPPAYELVKKQEKAESRKRDKPGSSGAKGGGGKAPKGGGKGAGARGRGPRGARGPQTETIELVDNKEEVDDGHNIKGGDEALWELRAEAAAKRVAELEAKAVALQAQVQQSLATQPPPPPPGGLPAPSHALTPAPSHALPSAPSHALPPAPSHALAPTPSLFLAPAPAQALPPAQSHSLSLPQGWKSAVDPQNGVYYYNKFTGVSQYERPTEDSPPLPPPVSRRPEVSRPGASTPLFSSPPVGESSYDQLSQSCLRSRIADLEGRMQFADQPTKAYLAGKIASLELQMRYSQ